MLFLSTATRFRIRAPVLPGLGRSQFAARGCPESLERRICELSLVHPHEKFTYFSSSLLIHLRAHAPVLRVLTIPRRSLILADRVRRTTGSYSGINCYQWWVSFCSSTAREPTRSVLHPITAPPQRISL